jgi:hypothetical protein
MEPLAATRPAALAGTLHGLRKRIDPVWLAGALGVAALALADAAQAIASLEFTARAVLNVLPFLLLSVAFAAASKATGADNLIAKAFQGRAVPMVVLAALVGALSPFCSCGVIPIIAALLAMGVPLAPVMAFWLSSPLIDPSMFVLTAGTLGVDFAIAKTVAAVGVGLLGGFGTLALAGFLRAPLRAGVGDGGCAGAKIRNPKAVEWAFWRESARRQAFAEAGLKDVIFLGKWLTLAFLLESLMVAYVPNEAIGRIAGGDGVWPVLIAALAGIPAYLNGYAALPLVRGLLEHGMAPGAAMAFLVGGGVTSIPAAMAVFAIARLRVFALYLGFAVIGAVLAGLAYGFVA